MNQEPGESLLEPSPPAPRKFMLGSATPRGYGARPRLSPEAAAAFATYVDTARVFFYFYGSTVFYTVRWN